MESLRTALLHGTEIPLRRFPNVIGILVMLITWISKRIDMEHVQTFPGDYLLLFLSRLCPCVCLWVCENSTTPLTALCAMVHIGDLCQGSQCSSVPTYILVVHNVVLS